MTSLHLRHYREIRPSFESGLLGSNALEAEITGSLSHTYCGVNTLLEVLVESWLMSSVKDRESALISRQHGLHGAFLEVLY